MARIVSDILIGVGVALTLAACAETAPPHKVASPPIDPAAARRGDYLVTAANCAGCHTDKDHGGAPFAGGKAIATPFGAYVSRNITPDPVDGIGAWSESDFLRALRRGISPAGAHYFPAFPYTSFTGMSDRDILDIRAYLMSQAPAAVPNRPHEVPFPFDVRLTMVVWRGLYFSEGPRQPDPARSAQWNRGAYLVDAVAHCGECHTPRTWLGGLDGARPFNGGRLAGPGRDLAPNITSDPTDGIGSWSVGDIETLLKTGLTPKGDFVEAPMSEVVDNMAKLSDADRAAIATYVKSLPPLRGKGG